jgi:hypothetical protein
LLLLLECAAPPRAATTALLLLEPPPLRCSSPSRHHCAVFSCFNSFAYSLASTPSHILLLQLLRIFSCFNSITHLFVTSITHLSSSLIPHTHNSFVLPSRYPSSTHTRSLTRPSSLTIAQSLTSSSLITRSLTHISFVLPSRYQLNHSPLRHLNHSPLFVTHSTHSQLDINHPLTLALSLDHPLSPSLNHSFHTLALSLDDPLSPSLNHSPLRHSSFALSLTSHSLTLFCSCWLCRLSFALCRAILRSRISTALLSFPLFCSLLRLPPAVPNERDHSHYSVAC